MYSTRIARMFARALSRDRWTMSWKLVAVRVGSNRRSPAVVFAVAVAAAVLASPVTAQTLIYDGSQELNFFSSPRLSDDLALPIVLQAGADPNVLEDGDAAWFRSSGRRMRNVDSADGIGTASSAAGVDGLFMTANPNASGTSDPNDPGDRDPRGTGAAYVLKDAKATTGQQLLNLSVYFNDPTPNNIDNETSRNSGGMAAIRVYGVNNNPATNPLVDPWESAFELLAASGSSGANIASGQYDRQNIATDPTLVESLLFYQSRSGDQLLPSTDWQQLSLPFDAGAGYDWLVFGFAGGEMDDTNLPADRFGFDNISFEAAPAAPGDYDGDLDVDGADFVEWQRTDETAEGLTAWEENFGATPAAASAVAAPEPSSIMLILLAASGLLGRGSRRGGS